MKEVLDSGADDAEENATGFDFVIELVKHWKMLTLVPIMIGIAGIGATYLVKPTFTSRVSFLPPQPQSGAAGALASLGALAGVAGAATGLRTPADQYVALMQSTTVQDRIIDRFELIKVYESKFRMDARKELSGNVRVNLSKRDGIIAVEVDDESPQRAADIANSHVEELRRVTSTLAITEAQQRRVFFESQLTQTKDRLAAAQVALQESGFNSGALRAEPKAAAEAYARLKAEATAAEVRLQGLRSTLADTAPEVIQVQGILAALRSQLKRAESVTESADGTGYVSKYREFKYHETLFELFSRQYELARVDEAREGALIQIIDVAQPAEKKSKPKRAITGLAATFAAAVVLVIWILARRKWASLSLDAQGSAQIRELQRALRGK